MIKIRDYKPNTPEWVMAKFFSCWKRRAWSQILDYVQPSWVARHAEPNRFLRYSLHRLVNAEFIQRNATTEVVAVYLMKISRKTYAITTEMTYAVKLVREGKKWGVDPNSLI